MLKIDYITAMERIFIVNRGENMLIDIDDPLRGTNISTKQIARADTILLKVDLSEFLVVKSRWTNYAGMFIGIAKADDIINHHILQYYRIVDGIENAES